MVMWGRFCTRFRGVEGFLAVPKSLDFREFPVPAAVAQRFRRDGDTRFPLAWCRNNNAQESDRFRRLQPEFSPVSGAPGSSDLFASLIFKRALSAASTASARDEAVPVETGSPLASRIAHP